MDFRAALQELAERYKLSNDARAGLNAMGDFDVELERLRTTLALGMAILTASRVGHFCVTENRRGVMSEGAAGTRAKCAATTCLITWEDGGRRYWSACTAQP